MRRHRIGLPSALAVLVTIALTGCSGSPESTNAASRATSPAASRTALQVTADDGSLCLERAQKPYDFAYWSKPITATRALVITGIRAESDGVTLVDGQVAPVVGGARLDTVISDWPFTPGSHLKRSVEWLARTALVGAELPVQRAMLPLLHFRAKPGGRLTGVAYDYRTADGETGTALATLDIRISAKGC